LCRLEERWLWFMWGEQRGLRKCYSIIMHLVSWCS
jgi:hypothetical protein